MMAPRPPQLIFNTDGHWVINYQDRWAVEDIVKMIPVLADCGVDALTALVGIDDDLSWRGSRYAQLWGDNVADWNPDPMTSDIHGNKMDAGQTLHVHGRPVKAIDGKMPQNAHECLYGLFAKLIADGHDLLQVYIDGARQCDMSIYAGFRMNDAHICDEARGWYGRSPQKIERPDLLIGQAVPRGVHGAPWGFSWRWDYAQQGVRERFLGLCDETLTRYDIDGVELDFSRAPPYFRSGEVYIHIPVMTEFVRSARAVVARHGADKRLIVRVPMGLGENLEAGLDTETWLREGLADIVALGSPGYCAHEIDIARAVSCAGDSGVLVFAGFDGATYTVYVRFPEGGTPGPSPPDISDPSWTWVYGIVLCEISAFLYACGICIQRYSLRLKETAGRSSVTSRSSVSDILGPGAQELQPASVGAHMVTAPPGSAPGKQVSVVVNGKSMSVEVPAGVRAGDQFSVPIVSDGAGGTKEPFHVRHRTTTHALLVASNGPMRFTELS